MRQWESWVLFYRVDAIKRAHFFLFYYRFASHIRVVYPRKHRTTGHDKSVICSFRCIFDIYIYMYIEFVERDLRFEYGILVLFRLTVLFCCCNSKYSAWVCVVFSAILLVFGFDQLNLFYLCQSLSCSVFRKFQQVLFEWFQIYNIALSVNVFFLNIRLICLQQFKNQQNYN